MNPAHASEIFYRLVSEFSLNKEVFSTPFFALFLFPGIGVGTVHNELSGCTNQLCRLRDIREEMRHLGVGIAAVSGHDVEHDLGDFQYPVFYVNAEELPESFTVSFCGEKFLMRSVLLKYPDGQVSFSVVADGVKIVDQVILQVKSYDVVRELS